MELLKLFLIITLLSFLPGQLIRIPISQNSAIGLTDLSIIVFTFAFMVFYLAVKRELKINPNIFSAFVIFILFALSSTILARVYFSNTQILVALLFLFRLILYFFFSIAVANIVKKDQYLSWLNLVFLIFIAFSLIGFSQLIIFPDLTSLAAFGWDPHQRRIVSTLLDPNFTGGILALIFSLALSHYVYIKNKFYLLTTLLTFATIVLTFSRSSYLALLASVLVIGILKSQKVLIAFLVICSLIFIFVPRTRQRVVSAFSLDETSQARIESWSKAIKITKDNPVFGVGFNTYRYTQERYGFFLSDQPEGGHSGSGTDSSILLVAATTGLPGLALFLIFLATVFKVIIKNVGKTPFNLGATAAAISVLVHSQFVNSLFYPQMMLFLFFIIGLALVHDS